MYEEKLAASGIFKDKYGITLDNYIARDALTKRAKDVASRYIINGFRNTSHWLAFLGQAGSGKTLLSIAIAMTLLNQDPPVKVIYMNYLDSMRELKAAAMDEENYMRIQQKFLTTELLIIDDLFKDKVKNGKLIRYGKYNAELSESDIRHINPIITYRYSNHKNTIINSECTMDNLTELDESLAGKINEMCADGKTLIEFQGTQYNYRFRNKNIK